MGIPVGPVGLAATTAVALQTGFSSADMAPVRKVARVVASGPFRLNLLISADGGTTNYVAAQVASTTQSIDGTTTTYTNSAVLDVSWPTSGQFQIYNPGASSINWVADVREYRGGGS